MGTKLLRVKPVMAKYEAHMTFDKKHADDLKHLAETDSDFSGWQYSAIDDDPIMGQKPYCYLTAYNSEAKKLLDFMHDIKRILNWEGIETLRLKVERIIYDSKTGVDEMEA